MAKQYAPAIKATRSETFYEIRRKRGETEDKVRITFTGAPQKDEEFHAFLKDMTKKLYKPKRKMAILFDTRNLGMLNMGYASGLGSWIKENKEQAKAYLNRSCVLIDNIVVRGFTNLLFSIQTPTAPMTVHGTLHDCVTTLGWLNETQ